MISNPNFCYSGAIILEALRNNKIQVGQTDIKKLLLSRFEKIILLVAVKAYLDNNVITAILNSE